MNLLLAFKALFLGIIEGLTEFLPISSTGHLIVAGSLIGFDAESHAVFNIAIQLGAILAVVYEYRTRFTHVLTHIGKDRLSNRFVLNLAIAFIPAAAIGLLLNDFIEKVLFNPVSVAAALVVGGFLILWIEKRQSRVPPKVRSVDDMRPRDALAVGLFQILALIPGTSRSGSTIMGGIIFMWDSGDHAIAAIIFSASIMIPVLKIFAMAFLLLCSHYGVPFDIRKVSLLYRITEKIGRWSMIDIFVIIILMSTFHTNIARVTPGPASLYFCLVVLLTMLSAHYFDPRLLWDKYGSARENGQA